MAIAKRQEAGGGVSVSTRGTFHLGFRSPCSVSPGPLFPFPSPPHTSRHSVIPVHVSLVSMHMFTYSIHFPPPLFSFQRLSLCVHVVYTSLSISVVLIWT